MRTALMFFSCLVVIECEFRQISYSLNLGAMVTLGEENGADVMTRAFRECGVQNVLLMTSSETTSWPVDWVLRQTFLTNVRMAHYDIDNNKTDALDDLIWDFYHRNQVRHFIIVTALYGVVIDRVTRLFHDKHRGEGAVLTHKTTFTLVVPSAHVSECLPDMASAVLDNVALVAVGEESGNVERVYTLMYRERRRREWESVDLHGEFSSPSCRIFPNRKFGLNGRIMTLLAKEWLSHLYRKTNKQTGRLEYVGFYVNIINMLSTSLNFTFNFTPNPDEEDTMTWAQFSNRVGFGEVDIGVTTYITNSALYFNHSVSFPILWSNVSGVYRNKERAPVTSPLKLFRLEVYGCLLASLLFTMSFHLILTNISLDNKAHSQNLEIQQSDIIPRDQTKHSHECADNQHPPLELVIRHRHRNSDAKGADKRDKDSAPVSDHTYQHLHVDPYNDHDYSNVVAHDEFTNNENTYSRYKSVGTQTGNIEMDQAICKRFRTIGLPTRFLSSDDFNIYYKHARYLQERECNTKTLTITHSDIHSTHQFSKVVPQKSHFLGKSERNGRYIEHVIELFFKFVGSIFSQDSLPEPKKCSARILLWSWCLMLLVLTAVFTGNITANLVDQGDSIPFSTFEELLQRKDYKWGVFHDSSFYNVMKNAKEGSTLKKLYDKMEKFALTDPKVKGSMEEQVIKLATEKYVTFFFTDDLEYLREQNNLTDLVIMKDNIMMSNMGFIFPKTSTLNKLVSESLLRMTDAGVLDYLHRTKSNRSSGGQPSRDSSETALDLFYMEGLFFCCGCGLALSGFFLILECIYVKLSICARRLF